MLYIENTAIEHMQYSFACTVYIYSYKHLADINNIINQFSCIRGLTEFVPYILLQLSS